MNRIERKALAPDAAKLFEAEVLAIWPDIPRDELCAMVDDFIFYQTDGLARSEAKAIVDRGCRAADRKKER